MTVDSTLLGWNPDRDNPLVLPFDVNPITGMKFSSMPGMGRTSSSTNSISSKFCTGMTVCITCIKQQHDDVYNDDNGDGERLLQRTQYHHHYRKENKTKKKNLHINSHATAHTDTVGKFDDAEDDNSFHYLTFIDHDHAFEDIFDDAEDDKFRNYDRMEEERKKMEEERQQEEEERKKMEEDRKKMEEARRLEEENRRKLEEEQNRRKLGKRRNINNKCNRS